MDNLENIKNARPEINIGPIKTVEDLTLDNISKLTPKDAKENLDHKKVINGIPHGKSNTDAIDQNQGKSNTNAIDQNQGEFDSIDPNIWDELQKKASQINTIKPIIIENENKTITDLVREKFKNSEYITTKAKYLSFYTLYDKEGNIHGYLYAVPHFIHKDFYYDIPDDIVEIISKANKVYQERFARDSESLSFSNDLLSLGFDLQVFTEIFDNMKNEKPEAHAWLMDLIKKMKELYALNKINDPNFSVAGISYIIKFLSYGFAPEDFVAPENKLSKIIEKNNINFDSLDKLEKIDNNNSGSFVSGALGYLAKQYKKFKNKDVQEKEAFDAYLAYAFYSIGDNDVHFGLPKEDDYEDEDGIKGDFKERHSLWIPKIVDNKNCVFCFGSGHFFGGGEYSIANQLKAKGFEIKNYYAEKLFKELEAKVHDESFTLNDINELDCYPYYQAKLMKIIMDAKKGEPEIYETIKKGLLIFIEKARQVKFKIGYTETDLDAL